MLQGDRFNFDRMESLMTQAVKPVGRRRLGRSAASSGRGGLLAEQLWGCALLEHA